MLSAFSPHPEAQATWQPQGVRSLQITRSRARADARTTSAAHASASGLLRSDSRCKQSRPPLHPTSLVLAKNDNRTKRDAHSAVKAHSAHAPRAVQPSDATTVIGRVVPVARISARPHATQLLTTRTPTPRCRQKSCNPQPKCQLRYERASPAQPHNRLPLAHLRHASASAKSAAPKARKSKMALALFESFSLIGGMYGHQKRCSRRRRSPR